MPKLIRFVELKGVCAITVTFVSVVFVLFVISCGYLFASQDDRNDLLLNVSREEQNKLFNSPILQVDALWAVHKMIGIAADPMLSAYLDSRKRYVRDLDPFRLLVDSSAKRVPLPLDPGKGSKKFYNFVLASVGSPADRAVSFISQFLSVRESGYFLTHQFLVIIWAEETGLVLPEAISRKKNELLDQIFDEQSKDSAFSDLYAERAAILILYSDPPLMLAEKWVKTILSARLSSGGWGEFKSDLIYDGEKYSVRHTPDHTRVLCLLTLKSYMVKCSANTQN